MAMQYSASQPSAGWYPDPAGSGDERYWDGTAWSTVTRPDSRRAESVERGGQGIYDYDPVSGPRADGRYASWGSRVAAYLLDVVILAFPTQLLVEVFAPGFYERIAAWMYEIVRAAQAGSYYAGGIPAEILEPLMTASIAVTVLGIVYRTLFTAGFGATPGKMVMRIHVTRISDPSGKKPGFARALGRTLVNELLGFAGAFLSFPLTILDYLMPLFTKKKQTLHDMMAGTIVVKN